MKDKITLRAYAKVNLFLDVLKRRSDNYHDIGTLFQSVSLYDDLSGVLGNAGEIRIKYDRPVPFSEKDDLIYKAADLLWKTAGLAQAPGINFELIKKLPAGGGLGGGSADAAAALRIANQIWNLGYSLNELEGIGATLGADVPFMIRGGTMIAEGIGDRLTRVEPILGGHILVATPNVFVSTPEAYAALTPSGHKRFERFLSQQAFWNNPIEDGFDLFNKFEETVFKKFPEIKDLVLELKSLGASKAMMSGSGASVFGLFQNEDKMIQAKIKIEGHTRFCEMGQFILPE
jgi:4-diphosphocytidyl-2-C-methyl-D-erythritol kinase